MRPTPYQSTGRLLLIVDALAQGEESDAVRALVDAFGGTPDSITERLVGEPPLRSRRLRFGSGGEIVLHDDAVVAVLLWLSPGAEGRRVTQLAEWLPGTTNASTFDDFKAILQSPWHFGGEARCFVLQDGYLRLAPRGHSAEFSALAFTAEDPKFQCRPEDDDCPSCSELLVRRDDGTMHLEKTIDALSAATAEKHLSAVDSRVALGDMRALHSSGLMRIIESQFLCRNCHRYLCLTLQDDAAPAFTYTVHDVATWRPFEAVPSIEQWASAERIAAEPVPMRYVDHEPGAWFLVERNGELFLDARYSYGSIVDDSALIPLDEAETSAYREGGHDYLTALARGVHNSAPYREESQYRARDLFRGEHSKQYRSLVRAAIVEHTWIAEQRRKAAE